MDSLSAKNLPHNVEAEQALLGACILNNEAINQAVECDVRPEDFFLEAHREIYAALLKLAGEGVPSDLVTLADMLASSDSLESVGGPAYLASLTMAVPSTASATYYAKIVAEKSLVRALVQAAERINADSLAGSYSATELLDLAEQSVFAVSQRKSHRNFYLIGDVAVEVLEYIGKIKSSAGVTGVPTFRDLDKLLSGLQKGDLIILAARPGMGKTSMALNIAQKAGTKHGKRVAIFSLEMPKEQLVQRMLCTSARVDQGKVRAGMANQEERARLSRELAPLSKAEIYIDDTPGISVMEVRSKCRRLQAEKGGLDLIIVDYLQLMQASGRRPENRQQEIAEISRSLKALAKELEVPVLALSQLSRSAENSKEPPSLSHLRESGALEQDADVVLFIHQQRDENYGTDGTVDVIVAKHRNGPTGQKKMVFLAAYTSFEDYAEDFGA